MEVITEQNTVKRPVLICKEKTDFGVIEESFEMGQEDTCKEANVEDGQVKFGRLVEEENGKVSLEGVLDDSVDIDANGNEKEMKSGLSEIKNDVGVKNINEIVGVEGTDVKSGEIKNV